MKKLTVLILTVLVTIGITAFAESPFFKVNGSVKSYTQTTYVISQKFGDYYRTPDIKYVHNLNDKQLETDVSQISATGLLVNKVTYTYDTNGNLESQVSTDSANTTEWKVTYVYDEKGRLTEESNFKKDDILSGKSIFKYPSDNQTEESYYNGDGVLLWRDISKFDENNHKVQILQYFADGTLDQRQDFIYNDLGILVQVDTYDNSGFKKQEIKYRFTENDLIGETQTKNYAANTETREFYKYDDDKNLIKITTYNVSNKFGTTVNELTGMSEYTYTK
ncbi:MAG: hypothetical protein K6E51_05920 [Treponema sp.]|nr:hypothetical protein [Treponema sp.]